MKHSKELSQSEHINTSDSIPFELGNIVIKETVRTLLRKTMEANPQCVGVSLLLERHKNRDWGELCAEGKARNDEATKSDGRIFSSYAFDKEQIWIITEQDKKQRLSYSWMTTESIEGSFLESIS
ncbi:hypothetical protein Sps_05601 [Shewanella psychrophila]|uniref:Type I restriction endonuclease subunit M n=1 Tax=Shewanella psychrophila TaxID=225848 RepID=A0A1S6HYY8_9GAMM|nr:hypothetical protein [Shewanella psychrophila]AQS40664.1 hypothetical protein Sps_05601 [Shewanella psychrophila]